MPKKGARGIWFGSLALIALGVVLLLHNFLLMSGFNVTTLWPLLLLVGGAVILIRGDLLAGGEGRAFGITRGSVESATLEINAGEIDVQLRASERTGRLIAGQFASDARPALHVQGTHTFLKLDRAATSWLSFADWKLELAQDLPWQVLITSSIGQVDIDLSGLIVQNGLIATGLGDIRFVLPDEAFETIYLRTAVGSVQVITPPEIAARITVQRGLFFTVNIDANRYEEVETGVYMTHQIDADTDIIDVHITGTFGDAYLA